MALELLKSKTGRTLIESHRGIEADVPENSWPAIKMGHEMGADLLEVDVQMSSDGVPFLRHNYQLPDGRWCAQLPWRELKNVKIDGEPFPLLEDVLVWARETDAKLSLDVKTFFRPEGSLTKEVVRLLERTNTKDNVLLLYFDHQELLQTKLVHPELTVRALLTGRIVDYAGYLRKINADGVSVSYGMLRPVDIEQIHSMGAAVALIEYWDQHSELFQQVDIDMLSCGNPVEARKILGHQ
ncbi:glycerophosphodiester phosphodiesterase [Candidatus Villigracilis affinis]|uniref:glycerophosphodiester phosphodiesterase n=1 Tax=Candidatus Villigracilis affinis TaxID=3140682 RepID=UPI002A224D02|nr:glycerophosphodiester phosphodiesterase [Anaerolineales bacterium]